MVDQLSMLNPAAKAVVYPVNPELKVLPASLADPVNPVLLANLETLASHQLLHANQQLHHHANPAHKDLPAHQVHPDLLETQERLVLLADLDMMLLLEPLDHVDHPDLLVNPALLDHLENPVFQHKANHLLLESLEKLEISDHLDLLDHLVNPVWTAHQDLLDQKENLDFPVITVLMEILDLQAHLDQLVLPARRVSARNTVPSTVVSSSKTALALISSTGSPHRPLDPLLNNFMDDAVLIHKRITSTSCTELTMFLRRLCALLICSIFSCLHYLFILTPLYICVIQHKKFDKLFIYC
jgi:hypothetical protein